MRTSSHGRKTTLKDDLADVLSDNLPQGDEITLFLRSKDSDTMLDKMLDIIDEHIEEAVQGITNISA